MDIYLCDATHCDSTWRVAYGRRSTTELAAMGSYCDDVRDESRARFFNHLRPARVNNRSSACAIHEEVRQSDLSAAGDVTLRGVHLCGAA